MRAFLGQFDRVSLFVFGLGAAIGATWLLLLDLGLVLTIVALLIGSIALVIRHRWIEIGLLMAGIGLVAQVGFWLLGPPAVPPRPVFDPSLPYAYGLPFPMEEIATGLAGLLLGSGVAYMLGIGAWDLAEGRRRERLEARHEARRLRRLQGS